MSETGVVKPIYLSPPHMGPSERELLLDAFDTNWIAPLGPHVDAFEKELAEVVNRSEAAAVSSGTAALHLALRLLGVGPGDEVIVPTFTFVATAAPVLYLGARPVFIDVDSSTWTIDPVLLAQELKRCDEAGRLPAAVIAVDLYGQCADYERLLATCDQYGVPLVEDAAEALGATCGGRPAGSFGTMAAFSFNGNKIITTSGGGMLVSDDAALMDKARFLATQARDPAPHYQHSEIGYNYRLSNLLAAVGRAQLRGLTEKVQRRREINATYAEALMDVPGVKLMPVAGYGQPSHWLTCITLEAAIAGVRPAAIRERMEAAGIECRAVWKPLHLQPLFTNCRSVGGQVAADIFDRGLCLPSGSGMSEPDLKRVIDTLLGCWQS